MGRVGGWRIHQTTWRSRLPEHTTPRSSGLTVGSDRTLCCDVRGPPMCAAVWVGEGQSACATSSKCAAGTKGRDEEAQGDARGEALVRMRGCAVSSPRNLQLSSHHSNSTMRAPPPAGCTPPHCLPDPRPVTHLDAHGCCQGCRSRTGLWVRSSGAGKIPVAGRCAWSSGIPKRIHSAGPHTRVLCPGERSIHGNKS